jgi:hypothetical protein
MFMEEVPSRLRRATVISVFERAVWLSTQADYSAVVLAGGRR